MLSFSGLLACNADPSAPQDAPQPTPAPPTPAPQVPGVTPPLGFVAMESGGVARLRSATIRGTATAAELDAWVAPDGAATGLVVSMNVRHGMSATVHGHTLKSWVRHNLQAVEDGLTALDAQAEPPRLEDDPTSATAVLTRYALPLPGGGSLRVWGRHWLSSDGQLAEATCQCAGSGCTEPPACTLPQAPADALPVGTVLGEQTPSTTLETTSGIGRLQAPPHLSPLPAAMRAQLETAGVEQAPRRSALRVQGLNDPDGSAAVLTEATWCAEPPACDAETLAENRRKAEVSSLRAGGSLRSIETHATPHSAVPLYGFEIEQHDGFWTRTTFWNDGSAVQEVSCSCAGLACALVQRTCVVEPASAAAGAPAVP